MLRSSRDIMVRQWEDALQAMVKRDTTMKVVNEKRKQAA